MFLGSTGLTAMNGSKESSSPMELPGKVTKLSSQVPTALGRESATSGLSVAALHPMVTASNRVRLAQPGLHFLGAPRRVADGVMFLMSSSNGWFIVFLLLSFNVIS